MSAFFFIDEKRVELERFSGFIPSPGRTVTIYQNVANPDSFYVYDDTRFVQTNLTAAEMIGYLTLRLHNVHYLLNKKDK